MSLIYKKISEVMSKVDAISKSNTNTIQKFKFRGVDDVYNAFHTYFKEAGIFSVPEVLDEKSEERTTRSGGLSIYRILRIKYTFYAEDGSNVSAVVIGEAMDSGDKASNKAMSIAHKYAILQIFCVPTEEQKDPDYETHDILPKTATARPQIYEALDHQKKTLMGMCSSAGITDPMTMGAISKALTGKPMKDMDKVINEFKEAENGHDHN